MNQVARYAPVVFLVGLLLSNCGGGGVDRRPVSTGEDGSHIDPFAVSDEFVVETGGAMAGDDAAGSGRSSAPAPREDAVRPDPVAGEERRNAPAASDKPYGYRVQIGIDENKDVMESLAERARSRLDLPVYLEFEAPFYRVRVGDFTTKADAERHVRILEERGFENSRWVFSRIGAR